MGETAPAFRQPNLGGGPDPLTLETIADGTDAVVLLFQRDYHCRSCREQARAVDERIEEFTRTDAVPVSVLPESRDRTADWADTTGVSYPVIADPDGEVSEAYEQPTRFGIVGAVSDLVGRMPLAVVVDAMGRQPTVAARYAGSDPSDRPAVDDLLADCVAIADDGAA